MFENVNKDSVEERLLSDACELVFQHMTHRDMLMLLQNKGEKKRVGRMREKKNDIVLSVSVITWHHSVLALLDYMGQRGFQYSDITFAINIHTAMWRHPNSS
jgi:hypothetical protein